MVIVIFRSFAQELFGSLARSSFRQNFMGKGEAVVSNWQQGIWTAKFDHRLNSFTCFSNCCFIVVLCKTNQFSEYSSNNTLSVFTHWVGARCVSLCPLNFSVVIRSDAWNNPNAIADGVSTAGGALVGSGGAQFWDFNTGAPGWSFSNSYASRVTSPACGLNGSSGGAIRTYAGSTYATSPSIDLSGVPSMPLHVMIRQGSSSCGEEPDSN